MALFCVAAMAIRRGIASVAYRRKRHRAQLLDEILDESVEESTAERECHLGVKSRGGDQAAAGFEPHPRLEQRVMVMVMVMVIEMAMVEAVLMKRGLERGSIRRRIERGAERVLETGVEITSA